MRSARMDRQCPLATIPVAGEKGSTKTTSIEQDQHQTSRRLGVRLGCVLQEAAATLLKAAEDGSLEAVLQKKGQARMHQDASISLKIRCPRIVTIPLAIPRRRSGADLRAQDTDALRQEAAATLLKAAKDGTLEAVLSKKGGQDFRTARLVAAVAVGPMHLRRRAGDFNCFESAPRHLVSSKARCRRG